MRIRRWTGTEAPLTPEQARATRRQVLGYVLLFWLFLVVLLYAAHQSEREAEPVIVSEPVTSFYGAPRDTSVLSRVCCRVLGR